MSNRVRSKIMGKQHDDIKYLMKDEIGGILAKGLTETYEQHPKNPVEYFAKWLLNYQKTQSIFAKKNVEKDHIEILKAKEEEKKLQEEERMKQIEEEKQMKELKNQNFWQKLQKSDDLTDNLSDLANYLEFNIGATGVYIGQLEQKMKPINDDDDDKAHIEDEAPMIIKFKYANKSHENIMIGQILSQDQGVTNELFTQGEEEEKPDDEDEEQKKEAEKDILQTYKHKFVKEVIREPKMHYWQVPKLGCYMAIPLIYKSCLYEEAIDKAIEDYIEVQKQRDIQAKERAEFEEEQQAILEEKTKTGEQYEVPKFPGEDINPAPFSTFEKKFVICIDTLGQDREFTDDQKRFALQTSEKFRQTWETFENQKLSDDRYLRMKISITDKEWLAENLDKTKEEEDKNVESQLDQIVEIQDEEHRTLLSNLLRLEYQAKIYQEKEEFIDRFSDFKKIKIFKYGKFMQGLLYFLGYDKEKVVEPGTQKFFWKFAQTLINESFLQKMQDYNFMGPKEGEFKKYQTINYIDTLIAGIDPVLVEEFNYTASRFHRWLLLAIESRKLDIIRRKALIQKERDERDSKIKAKEDRQKKRDLELEEMRVKFLDENKDQIEAYKAFQKAQEAGVDEYGEEDEDEDAEDKKKEPPVLPIFDEKEALLKWDEENPDIIIQDSTKDDIDNDWILAEEEIEAKIKAYWSPKEN